MVGANAGGIVNMDVWSVLINAVLKKTAGEYFPELLCGEMTDEEFSGILQPLLMGLNYSIVPGTAEGELSDEQLRIIAFQLIVDPDSLLEDPIDRFVAIALLQEGRLGKNLEYNGDTPRYGSDNWCARFVTWCAEMAGIKGTVIPEYTSCISLGSNSGIGQYAAANRFVMTMNPNELNSTMQYWDEMKKYFDLYDPNYCPKKGDVVFFRWAHNGGFHTGIYLRPDLDNPTNIITVEGNTGNDNCSRSTVMVRSRNKSVVFGYGKNTQ